MRSPKFEIHWRLNPNIVVGFEVSLGFTRVDDASGFHEHDLAFAFCEGPVACPFRDDMHFTGVEGDGPVFKFNVHAAFKDDEHFIRVAVIVPDKFAFNLDEFELVIVHFSDDFWRPVVREEFEFFREVNDGHGGSTTPVLLGSMPSMGVPMMPYSVQNRGHGNTRW